MITAKSNTKLHYYCRLVAGLKPGECIDISIFDLMDIPSFIHNDAVFTPPDRILENIVGSCYTHSYEVKQNVVSFCRHHEQKSGKQFYTSPDRR